MMTTAFYKQSPTVDTPYRQLTLENTKGHWQVRLTGGVKWGREHRQELRLIPAKSFEDAKQSYDKAFGELQKEGWRPYTPQQQW
jgi:hypothetical protein